MVNSLLNLIIVLAVLIVAWFIIERFSPDPLITKVCQVILFVIALVVLLKLLLPLVGVG